MIYPNSNRSRGTAGLAIAFCLTAFVLVFLSYGLPRFLPGDMVTALYSSSLVTLTPEQESELKCYYTWKESFGQYLSRLLRLEWGYSNAFQAPVSGLILKALPWTILLVGGAQLISILIGFMCGVEAAWRRGSETEKGLVGVMTLLEGVPEISTGVILLVLFALKLNWFPVAGAETAYAQISSWERFLDVGRHLFLPLSTLIIAYVPGNFLLTRNSMIIVIKQPFLETAHAKGLPAHIIKLKHAARNALLPVVTRVGMRLSFVITGALVVENIFSYPGLGTLLFNAISSRDMPLIQGIVLIASLVVMAANLALEMVYRVLDPRIRNAY
jgi:peptide/nickel transport system permease protein